MVTSPFRFWAELTPRGTARHIGALRDDECAGGGRDWACDTLATYCIYELRLSEDEAQRRCRAARVARQFPVLFGMLADASIHLTGILLLAPYLTEDNHREVLARARYRRKREIERLVAELAPQCDVPALVEPLGPLVQRSGPAPSTRAALLASLEGWVRRLEQGDGPRRRRAHRRPGHDTRSAPMCRAVPLGVSSAQNRKGEE